MIEKYESRRIRVDIRHVLIDVWDPIGIKDEPNAQDEYDSYLGEIMELLVSESSDEAIAKHLLNIVNETMGMTAPKLGDMRKTVKALRAIQLP